MDLIVELERATSRFAELASTAHGTEPVPACGGWSSRDLIEHLGSIHRWAASIVLSGQAQREPQARVTAPIDDWYRGTARALLAAITAVDPDEPVPNFSRRDETAAFWPRRQTHETTVHAVDLAQALGLPEREWSLDPVLAADGIHEVVTIFFTRMTARGARPHVSRPVRLTTTDVDRTWVVAPADDPGAAPILLDPDQATTSSVVGSAADLYLGLWHRVDTERLIVHGADAAALLAGPTTP